MNRKIFFFGNFGSTNFGNEATLQAILANFRALIPEAEFACICTFPAIASATHSITALPFSPAGIRAWRPKNRVARLLRRMLFGIPSELYRWWDAFRTLKGGDALIVPGTGLLTDAFDISSWGPYGLFKWALVAKLRGCKLLFVSVGAGPLDGRLGRHLAKMALRLADFRSYRDVSSLDVLRNIGFAPTHDRIYPDLAFSLPRSAVSSDRQTHRRRPVVGLGLMNLGSMYAGRAVSSAAYASYLESLVILVAWLLDRGYDIRLLIGEVGDPVPKFRSLLAQRLSTHGSERIMDAAHVTSVEELLSQVGDTDLVVATRFHNVLFALLSHKPTVSISFHSKCTDLMSSMGLSEYCLRIDQLKSADLIEKVLDMEKNSHKLKSWIAVKCEEFRRASEEQYGLILAESVGRRHWPRPPLGSPSRT